MQASAESCRMTTKHPELLGRSDTSEQKHHNSSSSLLPSRGIVASDQDAYVAHRSSQASLEFDEAIVDEEIISPLLHERKYRISQGSRRPSGGFHNTALGKPWYQSQDGFYVLDLNHIIASDPLADMLIQQESVFDLTAVLWQNIIVLDALKAPEQRFRLRDDSELLYHTNLSAFRKFLFTKILKTLSIPELVLAEMSARVLGDISNAMRIPEGVLCFKNLRYSLQQILYPKMKGPLRGTRIADRVTLQACLDRVTIYTINFKDSEGDGYDRVWVGPLWNDMGLLEVSRTFFSVFSP